MVIELKQAAQTPKKRERINKFKTHIKKTGKPSPYTKKNKLAATAPRVNISHVLSSRFSSLPMGGVKKVLKPWLALGSTVKMVAP